MTTKLIGIKEFRAKITSLWKHARKYNVRYVVMYHSEPIFEINPITEKEVALEQLVKDVKRARAQVKRGEVYTQEEIMKEFGLL